MKKQQVFVVTYDLTYASRYKTILVPALANSEDRNVRYVHEQLANSFKEVIEILKNAKGNLYYFIIVMLYTGIRPGELISLHWKDIDYDKKRIAIDKTTVNGK